MERHSQFRVRRLGAACGRLSVSCRRIEPISCCLAIGACGRVTLLVFVEVVESNVALVLPAVQFPQLLSGRIESSINYSVDSANRIFIFTFPSFANRACQSKRFLRRTLETMDSASGGLVFGFVCQKIRLAGAEILAGCKSNPHPHALSSQLQLRRELLAKGICAWAPALGVILTCIWRCLSPRLLASLRPQCPRSLETECGLRQSADERVRRSQRFPQRRNTRRLPTPSGG